MSFSEGDILQKNEHLLDGKFNPKKAVIFVNEVKPTLLLCEWHYPFPQANNHIWGGIRNNDLENYTKIL